MLKERVDTILQSAENALQEEPDNLSIGQVYGIMALLYGLLVAKLSEEEETKTERVMERASAAFEEIID